VKSTHKLPEIQRHSTHKWIPKRNIGLNCVCVCTVLFSATDTKEIIETSGFQCSKKEQALKKQCQVADDHIQQMDFNN
jgi:hypothetical protein